MNKPEGSEKLVKRELVCRAVDCPLLKCGKCMDGLFKYCYFGKTYATEYSSRRSKKFNADLAKVRGDIEKSQQVKFINQNSILRIDDFYYLPYNLINHVDLQDKIKFTSYAAFFSVGAPFMKVEDLTVDVVVTLSKFRPYALIGGEITDFQQKTFPRFLYDLSVYLPTFFEALPDEIKARKAPITYFTKAEICVDQLLEFIEWMGGNDLSVKIDKLTGTLTSYGEFVVSFEDNELPLFYSKFDKRGSAILFPKMDAKATVLESKFYQAMYDRGMFYNYSE